VVHPERLELMRGPKFWEAELEQTLFADLARLPAASLGDEEALDELLDEVSASSGWIREVVAVRKQYPDALELQVSLRVPVAAVDSQGGWVLLDEEGVVLGSIEEAPELVREQRPPLIHRPGLLLRTAVGTVVNDRAIRDGLAVVCELRPFKEALGARAVEIAMVDLSPVLGGDPARLTDVLLFTHSGVEVEWGRVPSSPLAGLEPTAAAKVRNVLRAAARYPRLQGVRSIRAQFHSPSEATVIPEPAPKPEDHLGQLTQAAAGASS
jgi:hypothetical protein